jgi:hypothetical protein
MSVHAKGAPKANVEADDRVRKVVQWPEQLPDWKRLDTRVGKATARRLLPVLSLESLDGIDGDAPANTIDRRRRTGATNHCLLVG